MQGVLSAELAILAHFKPVGVVLLVLVGYIVALLALRAGHGDFNSHLTAPPDYTAYRGIFSLPRCEFEGNTKKALCEVVRV